MTRPSTWWRTCSTCAPADGGRQFLIRWEGYGGDDTWEPETNLDRSLVREYMEARAAEEQPQDQAEAEMEPATVEPTDAAETAHGRNDRSKAPKKRPAKELPAAPPPKRAAVAPAPAPPPRFVVLEAGASMEVQGCGADCDYVCSECEWEACTVVTDNGETCDVCITSDNELCKGVQRRHVREPARAAQKRAVAAAASGASPPKQARAGAPPSAPAKHNKGKGKRR